MGRRYLNPVAVLYIALFLIPFFWFAYGEGDFGGDSSRLYFLDPGAWLKHYGLSEININDFGFHHPNYFLIPFLLLLKVLHLTLFNNVHLVLASFNGFLLATAFLAVYLIIRDLHLDQSHQRRTSLAAIVGALFFVLAPIMAYNWQKALYSWHQIAVYPLLVWLFLRYIHHKKTESLLYGLLLTVLFAPNFSAYAAPALFSFWPLVLPMLFVYASLQKKTRWLLRGLAIFIPLFLLLHSFHIFPQLAALFSPHNTLYQDAFTAAGQAARGLPYFEGVRPMVKLIYNLTAFPQYSLYTRTNVSPFLIDLLTHYGIGRLAIFLSLPLIIIGGVFFSTRAPRPHRILFLSCVLLYALALFLMTANLFGPWGPRGYAALFSLPGFAMFRSFYGVFMVPYIFLYALCFGLGLGQILRHSPRPVHSLLPIGLTLLLIYGSLPLLTGQVVNTIMPDTNNIKLSNRFPTDFQNILTAIKRQELDGKILTVPLTNNDYQIIAGARGGAYVGPSPLAILGGHHTFSGLSTFTISGSAIFNHEFFLERVQAHDYESLHRLFSLMNIGFIFENKDPLVYRDGFTGWPYSQELWQTFPTTESFHAFINELGYSPLVTAGPYTLYHNSARFLSHIYLPRQVVYYRSSNELAEYLLTESEYDLRTVFFLTQDGPRTTTVTSADSTSLEVKKINEMKYLIHLRNLRESTPLVFNQAWHPGWQLRIKNQRTAIAASYHQRANEYANAWLLDIEYLANRFNESLIHRPDGGYDLELILEFAPRYVFYGSAAVSLLTVVGIIGWLINRKFYAHHS